MSFRKYLEEAKTTYRIEVSLRDAKKAQNIINDSNIKFKMLASNYYDFKTVEDYDNIIDLLIASEIEIL